MEKEKLGLIAGGGVLPTEIIKHCNNTGREIFVIGLEPFSWEEQIKDAPHIFAKIGEVGKILKNFAKQEVKEIVMAGGIKRPSFKELIPDWQGAKMIAKLAIKKMGDNDLFLAVIDEIENYGDCGFKVVGIEDVVPEMLFSEGIYGKTKPSDDDMNDIQRGIAVARALGSVDVGQAAVVQEGIVLAVEAVEGTDMMLSRAATLKKQGKAPVMVKVKKPGQDTRTDLPAIGLQTIELLKKYGIKGIAVEAGAILLIEREAVIKMADEFGIFIIGMKI
ncbi:MAG: UDP-2,3-diacylglucosamine diphosphatase LpxI [Bacteroidales bacterium]|nr:UDP-2,3-diacylglucosamine diphosphatase LpxI [Bacteroidales bacterium]